MVNFSAGDAGGFGHHAVKLRQPHVGAKFLNDLPGAELGINLPAVKG